MKMNNIQEIWQDIKGYEGLYQISNLGRVKSFRRFNGHHYISREKILTPQKNKYLTVRLADGNKTKQYQVHRLVAETFIPNPFNKVYVNHINGNKKDNMVNNLEWCTPKENTIHAYKNNLIKKTTDKKNKAALNNIKKAWSKTSKKVNQYDLNNNFIKQWESISSIAKINNYRRCSVTNACNNKKIYKNYIWKYAMEEE